MKYILYAEDKDGYVTRLDTYEQLEDIAIRTSLFQDGTIITIETEDD